MRHDLAFVSGCTVMTTCLDDATQQNKETNTSSNFLHFEVHHRFFHRAGSLAFLLFPFFTLSHSKAYHSTTVNFRTPITQQHPQKSPAHSSTEPACQ